VRGPLTGKVDSFDKEVGLGQVRASDGRLYPFHCTEVTDGSRDIAVGTEVAFVRAAGHKGRPEARALVSVR
jgi:cold shock CspA family protein